MSEKILVADDSPTIQKVVGITLAKSDYELYEALSEDELFQMLEADHYDLLLLDFNLSENSDGYEICEKIRSITGTTKILAMLGTFDTVDEKRLEELGVSEKVIKPFESTKFIQKIKDSLSQNLGAPDPILENGVSDDATDEDDEKDEWSISDLSTGPAIDDDEEEDFTDKPTNPLDELKSEVEGWGMNVPGVIGQESEDVLMPSPMVTPSASLSKQEDILKKPNLVSLDELMGDDDDEEDLDKTDPNIQVEISADDMDLEKEMSDEVSPDEFWAVDEEAPEENLQQVHIDLDDDEEDFVVEEHPLVEVGPKLEKDDAYQPTIEALNSLNENEGEGGDYKSFEPVNIQGLLAELRPHLKVMIKEILDEMGAEATEKVAWEVIPDLAENLIREEVRSLSKKVQAKHSLS